MSRSSSSPLSALVLVSLAAACGGPPAPDGPVALPKEPADAGTAAKASEPRNEDFLYLEDVSGERSLAFARAHNAISEKVLTSDPGFKALESKLFSIYSSQERIPAPSVFGETVRNFWTDGEHPRGLWRQTTLADYRKAKPTWTTILDIDALGKSENKSWVFHGAQCLQPLRKRCLLLLSPGGGDAEVIREFDTEKKAFVAGGFELPEAKSSVAWKDENTIYVGTDFGAGSLTKSGYPRLAKEWKRGTPITAATTIIEASVDDDGITCERTFLHEPKRDFCTKEIDFEHHDVTLLVNGKWVKIDKPADADFDFWNDEVLLRLRSAWTTGTPSRTFAKGTLMASNLDAYLRGERTFQVLFEPTEHSSLDTWVGTKSRVYVNALVDVKNQITMFSRKAGDHSATRWVAKPVAEKVSTIRLDAFDPYRGDDVWMWLEDLSVPATLASYSDGAQAVVKQSPAFFDASTMEVKQYFATSKDGTRIPYFELAKKNRTGPVPTIIWAYGGFEISINANYAPKSGAAWVDRGGVYIQANLRGGGEYGPAWHEAVMKRKRQSVYDDMAAVSEDVVKRGVTTAKKLGIIGGSNGGLLTAVMLTERPELYGAVVSEVPLTDMERFHKLLAGASWMNEYGNPEDPGDWAVLSTYSPLHNVKRNASYPPMFFTTSTKDDRVHPAHARKMVAKLEAYGYQPLYYENIEGGHGGAADSKQLAYLDALVYTFFATRLGLGL